MEVGTAASTATPEATDPPRPRWWVVHLRAVAAPVLVMLDPLPADGGVATATETTRWSLVRSPVTLLLVDALGAVVGAALRHPDRDDRHVRLQRAPDAATRARHDRDVFTAEVTP
jgi:hypothetical protein